MEGGGGWRRAREEEDGGDGRKRRMEEGRGAPPDHPVPPVGEEGSRPGRPGELAWARVRVRLSPQTGGLYLLASVDHPKVAERENAVNPFVLVEVHFS